MAIVAYFLFWSVFCIIEIIKKERNNILGIIVLLIISALFSLNYSNADTEMYKNVYINSMHDNIIDHANEFLYLMLNKAFCYIGFDYDTFHCLLISSCMAYMYIFFRNHSKGYTLAFVLYCLTGGLFDYIQQRQFLSICIILFGLRFLQSTKKSIIKYIITVAVASLVHLSSVFYLVLLPICIADKKKRNRTILIIFIIAVVEMIVVSFTSLPNSIMEIVAGEKLLNYYVTSGRYSWSVSKILIDIIFQQVFLFVITLYAVREKKEISSEGMSALITDALLIGTSPVNFISAQYKRVLRLMIVPSFCVISEKLLPHRFSITKKQLLLWIGTILYVVIYIVISLKTNPTIISDLFQHNLLLKLLG